MYGKCRCCMMEGYHKDLMKECIENGKRVIYNEVFIDCFNLFLTINANITTLICSSCVQRLHDANKFKMLVVETEKILLDLVADNQTVFINVPPAKLDFNVKNEYSEVKYEPNDNEEDDPMDYDDFLTTDTHTDVNFEKQIKQSQEIDSIEADVETKLLSRFPLADLKRLPTRFSLYNICRGYAKHLDTLKGKVITVKTIKRQMDDHRRMQMNLATAFDTSNIYISEKLAHINNVSTLLEFSTIVPFKSKNRSGFPCFYCRHIYGNLDILRDHQTKMHRKCDIKKVVSTYGAELLVVYADITQLKCTLCSKDLTNLNELKSHLTNVHEKKLHLEYTDRVIPFKLSDNNIFECQVCGFSFETFGSIERHMNTHYRNYVCKDCGAGFITKYRLKVHMKSMHAAGNFPCDVCKKIFNTHQKYKMHYNTVHNMMKRFKCPQCPERFTEYFRRQKHMVEIHGMAPLIYKCNVCDKEFDRRYTLSRHMKRDHLEERDYKCDTCAYQCFTNNELRVHMIKHYGERIYECSVCKKSYARKKTLREHMRIHNNDRRFACAVCGQAFVQKCSLKGHIKTHHIEYTLQ